MARLENPRIPADVITIVRDTDVLDEILVVWDRETGDPVVKATYLVPDPDGTLRRETRTAGTNPTGFINSVFSDTK